jgi:hypothetical protein
MLPSPFAPPFAPDPPFPARVPLRREAAKGRVSPKMHLPDDETNTSAAIRHDGMNQANFLHRTARGVVEAGVPEPAIHVTSTSAVVVSWRGLGKVGRRTLVGCNWDGFISVHESTGRPTRNHEQPLRQKRWWHSLHSAMVLHNHGSKPTRRDVAAQ